MIQRNDESRAATASLHMHVLDRCVHVLDTCGQKLLHDFKPA